MNKKTQCILCLVAFMLSACGSDYASNPVVLKVNSTDNNIDQTNIADGVTLDNFSRTQIQALQSTLWQTRCTQQQIVEITFSVSHRITSIYTFKDSNCTTLANQEPLMSTDPYVIHGKAIGTSGIDITQIEFTSVVMNTTNINRAAFVVQHNILYFAEQTRNSLQFPNTIHFNTPYYSVSSSQKITPSSQSSTL